LGLALEGQSVSIQEVLDGNRLSSSSALGKAPSLCFFERPLGILETRLKVCL
jgi:hypothetical protein